ncbi:aldehyde dehydrogenase (NADP(+)) [Streptomyces poonensis]|uniref:2,5-dioxovalerate dehydrogenase n=1 Tax=Streptomyces poonensis TaxID=68255 RepID=A0A918P8A6_9ACTN|nr:aldehyde dehydrogenase (NADP(+)) [Streptomyces poonensis]GGY90266.1 2,5-dioxovalerate dehydrogenase [Streptomyces poonensis]GLJ87980.1 2,5-dioxovalerate dehydrogenase [Streptomyces poonensis]
MSEVYSMDPRTGLTMEMVAEDSDAREVARVCAAAAEAAVGLDRMGAAGRATLLEAVARELESDGALLVRTADRETALGAERLSGELARTCGQLRFFADVLREGSYADAVIDRAAAADDTGPGRPDMRRMLLPLGPVAVFGSSNFPLAFSVAGGDTASALAAGCPVVVKAHPSHPATSLVAFRAVTRAVAACGAPVGTVGIVWGFDAGRTLVLDPRIKAVGFTGSLSGGRHLHRLATSRPEPIPFHGELSSLNPVFVTPGAARERAEAVGRGFVQSFSFGHGQVCTKPGLLLVPAGADGAALREEVARAVAELAPSWLLNDGIRSMFRQGVERLSTLPGVRPAAAGRPAGDDERLVGAALVSVDAKELLHGAAPLMEECFGPFAVLAEYHDTTELEEAAEALAGQLSCAVHATDDDHELAGRLLDRLTRSCGRIVWNGFTTGVAVGWATHHGGPYPATTSPEHTSVGAASIGRFLRPVCYQSVPDALLPPQLRDANPLELPRRVDGVRC